ncbi:MAG: NAD-dependent epimerase/dehydratase family protein [Xanthobacteraceae bacterium]
MSGRILVLGAAGRLGHAAAEAFRDNGWSVSGLVRPGTGWRAPQGIEVIETRDRTVAVTAARGADIVLHALNPPYTEWAKHALPLTYSAIEAAETSGATLIFPGNVYNFGAAMPPVLDESTSMNPTSRKGRLRVEIEQLLQEASDRGMRTIVLRGGDFFGRGRGSWFDLVVVKEMNKGRLTYPGPPDLVHAWCYLPDFVECLLRLAEKRDSFGQYESFGFPGHAVTGRDFTTAVAKAAQRPLQVKQVNWWMIHTLGRLTKMGRELSEIGYLWRVPHRIDGRKLEETIGKAPHTRLDAAITQSLRELGLIGQV